MKIAMSSGHSTKCQGAIGYLNEVKEATRVTDRLHEIWRARGVTVEKFHDTVSDDSSENLNRIVDWHNAQPRDLDISVHFNAYQSTSKPMGSECLYVTQSSLAAEVSSAMAGALALPNRGAKYRNDLFFLNQTNEPSILLEVCFVDSTADAAAYGEHFEDVCQAVADAISGEFDDGDGDVDRPERPPPVPEQKVVDIKIYAPPGVRVDVSINEETEGK
jgi:N-acetylmuramoyl-L-alanine amidase